METFKITKEMLVKAKSYMPLNEKIAYSKSVAEICLKEYKTAEENAIGEKFLAFPYLKGEDMGLKSVLLLNVLLGFYFDIDVKENNEKVYEQYDYYAGGNILNQIERFKSDYEVKDKVFDLIADYKDFKKMVDTEIYNLKTLSNDSLARLSAAMTILSSPENISKFNEELQKVLKENEDKLKKTESSPKIENKAEEKVNA